MRRLLCESGLDQAEAAALVGTNPRRIRRFLAGEGTKALDLACELERVIAGRRAA